MRLLGNLAVVFISFFAVADVRAQSAPAFDPRTVPYQPVLTALDNCGLAVGVHPEWTHRVERGRTSSGNPSVTYNFQVANASQSASPTLRSIVTPPLPFISVSCERRDGALESFWGEYIGILSNGMYQARRSEGTYSNISQLQTINLPGIAHGSVFYADQGASTYGWFFGRAGAYSIHIFAQVQFPQPPAGRQFETLPAGTVVQGTNRARETVSGTLTQPLLRASDGSMFPQSPDQAGQRAFIRQVLQTVQGLPGS